jgi:hypothetical protein
VHGVPKMLEARREPTFDGSQRNLPDSPPAYAAQHGSRLSYWVNAFQLVGALLAVPVALGSAYSLYRANFSAEPTCQSLRAGIISMLDKNVDASTRRALVRRDVDAFEQTCGAVDPDATKAFKALLAADKALPAGPAPVVTETKAERTEALPIETVRKAEPRQQQPIKQPAARREQAVSDTQWLDAVRQAMAPRNSEAAAERSKMIEAAPTLPPAQPIVTLPAPALTAAAPASLSPSTTPAQSVAPRLQVDADHPVPPGTIPDPAEAKTSAHEEPRSWLGGLVSRVPLLGLVWDNR